MVSKKRGLDDTSTSQKSKKPKKQDEPIHEAAPQASLLSAEEVDFPRGGGTSLTALEVKAARAEAVKEADAELFEEKDGKSNAGKRKNKAKSAAAGEKKSGKIRIEHLNYKRLGIGMKVMGQVVGILPLALLISLPNQLLAHVPITNISSQYTDRLERMEEEMDTSNAEDDEELPNSRRLPELGQIFQVGQYIRAIVTAVNAPGTNDPSGLSRSRDELAKNCRRVELSLLPGRVNEGVQKGDLKGGFTLTAAVKSVEDHGYVLDIGVPGVDGFLSFKESRSGISGEDSRLSVGQILETTVLSLSSNQRTCKVSVDPSTFKVASNSEVASVKSVLPGSLAQALVTDVSTDGVNIQLLGFFEGTVDRIHLRQDQTLKVGQKVKGRVLYQHSAEPPRFAVGLSKHLVDLDVRKAHSVVDGGLVSVQGRYPLGSIIESAKVTKLEAERGIYLEAEGGLQGFVHISHVSDDHLPTLTSNGPWKVGTLHRGRVTGYHGFDGLLQISLKPSIFEHDFLRLTDFKVGESVKGTIKSVSDTALFVNLTGKIDAVVWPNHFADIKLKQPARRFKPGATIKCKILVVDEDRKRIALTAKRTLLDSDLPVISKFEDARPGLITHAVVFKVFDKHVMVEFYNNVKAMVPIKEASDTPNVKLTDAFQIGRVVRVQVLNVDLDQGRIVASIRQALATKESIPDVSAVEIGDSVQGNVTEVHAEHVLLSLDPTKVRALVSIKNLANNRKMSPAQIHASLRPGDSIDDLLVVSRNPEKGLVIVAKKPSVKPSLPEKGTVNLDTLVVGQLVGGRVTRHTRNGTLVKITAKVGGIVHPTDTSDDFEAGAPFLPVDAIVRASVLSIDKDKRQVTLSTRESRVNPNKEHKITDKEIVNASDLHVGDTVRGYVKRIAEHGLFVTMGREIDARVQIRELFDEFIKDWKPKFKENQLVKGRVLGVDSENNKVELTFKSGDLGRESKSSGAGVKEGEKIAGVIKRIEPFGLFIDIEGTRLHGLCHKSQLTDNAEADVSEALQTFRVGDRVKAMVTAVEKGRISLSLKPSHFAHDDFEDDAEEGYNDAASSSFGAVEDDEDKEEMSDVEEEGGAPEDSEGSEVEGESEAGEGSEEDDDGAMQVDIPAPTFQPAAPSSKSSSAKPIPSLTVSEGFRWFEESPEFEADDGEGSSDESDREGEPLKKKKKRREIERDFTADMHTKTPESNSDFERLLLGSPNSSYLWIQYMSFQLQIAEVDKAREVGRRAVKTISFREEGERLNVWIALLNLENVYGTDESLDAVFKEAARANDSKTIHLRMATIFDQSDKVERAEEQFKKTGKRFGRSCKVWTQFGEFFLKHGKLEEARKLLPRSLQSLEKRKHLKTISRFAQLEYKFGDPERGRTLFEGIVDSHPKRWDIWSIYVDMEAGQKDVQPARNIMNRVLALKMTSHKAKAFFKKWLDIEKRIGDEEGVDVVKQKAVEWTQRAAAPSA